MTKNDLIKEIVATYEKHGWSLKSALLRSETKAEIDAEVAKILRPATMKDSKFDALWFSRVSHRGSEGWELRLVAETPYALFERVEKNEPEEKRAEVFKSMEERLSPCVGS